MTQDPRIARLRQALDALALAKGTAIAQLAKDFPPGAPVEWRRNGLQGGVVRRTSPYNLRLEVQNTATGCTYRISASDILAADLPWEE